MNNNTVKVKNVHTNLSVLFNPNVLETEKPVHINLNVLETEK